MVALSDNTITYLTRTMFRNRGIPFGIKESDRLYHMYVIGRIGIGKSLESADAPGYCARKRHGAPRSRDRIRRKHYSIRTEQAYVTDRPLGIASQQETPPWHGAVEVEGVLTHLAVAKGSASTQNQAKSAILFLYKEVLGELCCGLKASS